MYCVRRSPCIKRSIVNVLIFFPFNYCNFILYFLLIIILSLILLSPKGLFVLSSPVENIKNIDAIKFSNDYNFSALITKSTFYLRKFGLWRKLWGCIFEPSRFMLHIFNECYYICNQGDGLHTTSNLTFTFPKVQMYLSFCWCFVLFWDSAFEDTFFSFASIHTAYRP